VRAFAFQVNDETQAQEEDERTTPKAKGRLRQFMHEGLVPYVI
jgi:hypothetical protein